MARAIKWENSTAGRTGRIGKYKITDMGNIVAVVIVSSTGETRRFIGQFASLSEALEAVK